MTLPAVLNRPTNRDRDRIDRALTLLARIPRLPDHGRHGDPDCWQRHLDCLAARIEHELTRT